MTKAILRLSDGADIVSLLGAPPSGIFLDSWRPAIAGAKNGGVFQSSSLSEGRQLAVRMFSNATETFNLKIGDESENLTIADIQDLIDILENAIAFLTGDIQQNPVYIEAKAKCEDNSRKALVISYSWQELGNPYAQPFFGASQIALMDEIVLIIERGHWGSNAPGKSDCTLISSVQEDWEYQNEWITSTSLPNNVVQAIFQISNGDIYASGGLQLLLRSQDNGDTWASNLSGAPLIASSSITKIIQHTSGNIICSTNSSAGAANDGTIRSDDNGTSWVGFATGSLIRDMIELFNQTIIGVGEDGASGDAKIYLLDSDGDITSTVFTLANTTARSVAVAQNGNILVGGEWGRIWLSTNDGLSWVEIQRIGTAVISNIILGSDNNLYLFSTLGATIYKSIDNGLSWQFHTNVGMDLRGIFEDINTNGRFFTSSNEDGGSIFISTDYMSTWFQQVIIGNEFSGRHNVYQTTDRKIYAGDNGNIFSSDLAQIDLGRAATCLNEVYIGNKSKIANITNIKIDDGTVFSDIFPITTFPQNLLPTVPVINDAVYFGVNNTIVNNGPFDSLVFDIGSEASASGNSFTLVWEYWNGAWTALTVHDNTNPNVSVLGNRDVNSVHWKQPADWITTTVDSITGYWIRLRLSTLVGTLTPPTQQNRDIYTITQSFINIDSTVVNGEIPAILQQKLENQSDEDGRDGDLPNLWTNRIICGLRSTSRGLNFQSYLNVSDTQNPLGVTVADTGTNTTFVDDKTTPTGRRATYNPASAEAMATQVTISLGSTIARDFYGKFHIFLRVQRTAGAITDFDIQLQFVSGSGGIEKTTSIKQIQTTTQWELLDFGAITLPVGGQLRSTDLGDITEIRIQASAASGTPNLNLYDLILMPVDEWAGDFVDFTNNNDSIIGRNNDISKLLDIDSITNPKIDIRSLVRIVGNEQITSVYDPITPNKATLQANAQQRLWFLAAQSDQTGTLTAWIAPPEISHSGQLEMNERWLTMRGDQ